MAEYIEEKYAKEVLEVKDSFEGLDSLIPPENGEIYINNKGAVLTSVSTLMEIWEHPEMKDRVFEKLEEMCLEEMSLEECPSNDKEQMSAENGGAVVKGIKQCRYCRWYAEVKFKCTHPQCTYPHVLVLPDEACEHFDLKEEEHENI